MGVLQEFERRLEGAVEGFFARAFRSGLQPIELAKAVQRYIADHQHVTSDGVVVPNVFRVQVGSKDHERLSSYGASLPRELGEVVVRTAGDRGWILKGPVRVRVDRDDAVRVGRYLLQGRVEAVDPALASTPKRSHAPGIDHTQVVTQAPRGDLRLVAASGPGQVELARGRISVGRQSSCDLTLDDSTVSREHAALVKRGEDWWVVDLGSTNGTKVNGVRVTERQVDVGDVIEFGGVAAELVEA